LRFFNTFNHVAPLLDYLLPELNKRGIKASAYISRSKYRKSNRGDDIIKYFEKSRLTALSTSFKAKFHVFFTQPPLYPIIGAWLSRLRGVPYAIHIMDHYPGLVGALGYLDDDGVIYKFLDKRMDKALQGAEFVTVLGACMRKLVEDKGVSPDRIKQVINVPSIKDEPLTVDYLEGIGLKDKFTIIYAGNMGIAHEFRTILEVASKLEETHPDIHFIMLGKGHRKKEVVSYYESNQPKNMTLVGYLEKAEFTAIMKQTELHLITLRDKFNGLLVPSKLYSSMALGKPVLFEGPEHNEITSVLKAYGAGSRVAHLDSRAMESAILEYYNDASLLSLQGENAQRYFKEQANISKFIGEYASYIEDQLQNKKELQT